MLPIFQSINKYIHAHRYLTGLGVLVLIFAGYKTYSSYTNTDSAPRYVIGKAEKQTIVVAVSGSGQVATENQVDVKARASGDITFLRATAGSEVTAGTLLATIDTRDAEKLIRDAQVNLESARLSLEKLTKPADALSLTQSENTLLRAKESKENAEANLIQAYEEGFNAVSNTFLDTPTVMTGLQDILFTYNQSLDINSQNIDAYTSASRRYDSTKADKYREDTYAKYVVARAMYEKSFDVYKSTSRSSSTSSIATLISNTYEMTRSIADAIKSTNNLIQFYKDNLTQHNLPTASISTTHLNTLNTYTGQTNGHLASLLSVGESIKTNQDTLVNAGRTITENTQSLEKLRAGTDALDIASAQLTIAGRENALRDAQEKLSDYYIRAPFAGLVATVPVKKGGSISTGATIVTLVTKQKIAEISLNEVDAARVHVGQKATLTFDAIEELSIAGKVVEIDTVGTVTQGVVTYLAKISFDTQDERVKSGMSVSAAIITDVKQDVLAVPASALKSRNNAYYVQTIPDVTEVSSASGILSPTLPTEVPVEIGISNDVLTEIQSGATEGMLIVTRTIAGATANTTSAPSLFGGSGGGGVRMPRN